MSRAASGESPKMPRAQAAARYSPPRRSYGIRRSSARASRAIAPAPVAHRLRRPSQRRARDARRRRRRPVEGTRSPGGCAGSRAGGCRSRGLSGQQLVDLCVSSGSAPLALLMMARDQLANESEGEELEPDDDEEHAEREQRAMPDRLAAELEHGQVDQDAEADRAKHEPERPEEMQRPVAVATHERDREQVEERAKVALGPVARATVRARTVTHR